ncbi:TetR/AcrR family transcriptional regulator [Luteipulveratus mongoliensis]|uniref:Transcriptional regulator n=1 Tax=Luteipulveratus mongoliensis TaxID=571913 RepID=A0A0K1JFW1_9MICO|nr:TetR family transcriptional regulator [Luteipulveratus mongoliensis]AKU15485.1 transcriptional regulator [Luteipulveratus mongoliensis]
MARMSADERRELLVEAAIRVMTRDGVAKATTRSIVAEADMQLGMFHYCFRSKQELLEQVIEAITGHSLERAGTLLQQRTTVRDTLRAAMQMYWDHVLANPDEHQLTYELTQYALREPGFEGLARKQYEFYLETLVDLLDSSAKELDAEFTIPTAVLARYLITIIDGLTLNWIVLRDDKIPEAVLDEAADHIGSLSRPAKRSA